MDTQTGTSPRDGDDVVDRRRLLQGAVAAGVGVVAWSSPSITSIVGTPAYAAACTGGKQSWFIGARNTSCNCDAGGVSYVNYKQLQSDCGPGQTFLPPTTAGVPTVWTPTGANRTVTMNWSDAGNCPPGTSAGPNNPGDATVTISAPIDEELDTLQYCVLRVDVTQGQCGNVVGLRSAVTEFVDEGGGTVDMPLVSCQAAGNVFVSAYLECADDEACLTPAVGVPATPRGNG